jgi:peroxiredoxin
LREQEHWFNEHDVKVVIVTFEGGFFARQYTAETGTDWTLLIDESRQLYREYNMLHASFWDIWQPKTWLVYLREILKGNKPKQSSGDISQRGGDVLVDPGGIVRLHHVGQGPGDRPPVREIQQAVR